MLGEIVNKLFWKVGVFGLKIIETKSHVDSSLTNFF